MNKITKSIELPEVEYKLTKKGSLNKNFAMISKGEYRTGPLQTNPIRIGQGVIVGRDLSSSFYTTEITKIRVLKNKIIFHTLNSVYELVEIDDSKDIK